MDLNASNECTTDINVNVSLSKLTGYIEYRLQLFTVLSHRRDHDSIHDDSFKKKSRKRKINECESLDEHISRGEHDTVGFFFRAEDSGSLLCETSIRIITSESMMSIICHAARSGEKVIIHKYSWRHCYLNDNEREHRVLELHFDGLTFVKSSDSLLHNTTLNAMSLREVQKLEQEMEKQRKETKKNKQSSSQKKDPKQFFNITGTVDAISTIIAIEPSDPFALIELYDPDCPQTTAVVVLKGVRALCCQSSIVPGQILSFTNVARSRWHIPKSFQRSNVPRRLHYRAPSHVFVVTDSKSLHLGYLNGDNMSSQNRTKIFTCTPKLSFELPSTVSTLDCIEGRVISIQYSGFKQIESQSNDTNAYSTSRHVIHDVIICKFNKEQGEKKMCKLHLLHFPQSPELLIGLTVGSYVCAMNVHSIPFLGDALERCQPRYKCFGACLRSTISIRALISDIYLMKEYDCKDAQERSISKRSGTDQLPDYGSLLGRQFYIFNNVKSSYTDYEWILNIRNNTFGNLACIKTIHTVLKSLLSTCRRNNCQSQQEIQRDPYKEWFDHACDDETNDTCEVTSCCFLTSKKKYPAITALLSIRKLCIDQMNQNLITHLSDILNVSSLHVGWTASLALNKDKLSQCCINHPQQMNNDVYVGGIITQLSYNGELLCQMEDGMCQLPFIPIFESQKRKEHRIHRVRLGDFCVAKICCAVVSCFYIGRNKNVCNEGDSFETLHIPPLVSKDNRIQIGSCQLTNINGHFFIVSVQLHYDPKFDHFISESEEIVKLSRNESCRKIPMTKLCNFKSQINDYEILSNKVIFARLQGLRWRPRKSESSVFKGCVLDISFLPTELEVKAELLSTQLTRLKLHVPFHRTNSDGVRKVLLGFSTMKSLPPEVINMTSAWREIAEDAVRCPLITYGHEDNFCCSITIQLGQECLWEENNMTVCTLSAVNVRSYEGNQEKSCEHFSLLPRERSRKLPGELEKLYARDILGHGKVGELFLPIRCYHGTPTLTIASLSYRLLQDNSLKHPNLGLAFRVANVQVIALRFCAVKIQCTKCFRFLSSNAKCRSTKEGKTMPSITTSGRHFWNEPLERKRTDPFSCDKKAKCILSNLKCPSGCNYNYASPKWELSCFVNDSTGLVKLYAEREVAIALFGRGINVDLIEEAAWQSEHGVVFQRGVAFSSKIKRSVCNVGRKLRNNKQKGFQTLSTDMKNDITIKERALLELYYFAKKITARRLDIICREKKIHRDKTGLSRSEICTTTALGQQGKMISSCSETYSLPLLELKLEDCSRCIESCEETGWSMIQSL